MKCIFCGQELQFGLEICNECMEQMTRPELLEFEQSILNIPKITVEVK